jgi:hypothetical protein
MLLSILSKCTLRVSRNEFAGTPIEAPLDGFHIIHNKLLIKLNIVLSSMHDLN